MNRSYTWYLAAVGVVVLMVETFDAWQVFAAEAGSPADAASGWHHALRIAAGLCLAPGAYPLAQAALGMNFA